jgi:putative nucleotidyltransferase with HDIG domain
MLRQGDVLLRLALCGLAGVLLWAVTGAWAPPLSFREGEIPTRDVLARVDFNQLDEVATVEARQRARSLALAVYDNDVAALEQLRAKLQNTLNRVVGAKTLGEFGPAEWRRFEPPRAEGTPEPTDAERAAQYARFREALAKEGALDEFKKMIADAFAPLERQGLMEELPPEHEGNLEKIFVQPLGQQGFEVEVPVADVLKATAAAALQKNLAEKLPSVEVADRVFAWLRPQLPTTLALDKEATLRNQEKAVEKVGPVRKAYPQGAVLAKAGAPLDEAGMKLLRGEHAAFLARRPFAASVYRSLAAFGMYIALYTLCGFYIVQREPSIIRSLPRFFALLSLVVLTVTLCELTARDRWNAELIPLLLFAMTIAIAYHQELALLLSASVALIVVFAVGQGLVDMVIVLAAVAAAILMLRSVRTRSKLLYVGIVSGVVATLTTLGVGTLEGQMFYPGLLMEALRHGLWAVIAGSLMTCLLPFIERMFDVQTDLSLIELGDPAHPLLQELVRRAPGTYNHSITVASLAEAAAEAIGARGLLVRVGAYFHDIGKMLKPGYFIENQSRGDNRHESLVPAMSTLVIIAHVKDGADLARQHHLPDAIIDFIQQHHGTTLVEYFYRRASEQSEANPNGGEVDESTFRYPGPKPQTKEAAVLMLADAVESASRVLVEPTPARIENLVDEIAMKRLLDGQFDECGLTLREMHMIQESLSKSLTAVYHGRVKYPSPQTA